VEKLKDCSTEKKVWFSKSSCKINKSYYIFFVKKRVVYEVDFSKLSSQWSLGKERSFRIITILKSNYYFRKWSRGTRWAQRGLCFVVPFATSRLVEEQLYRFGQS